jgi:hypothetical protein
MESGDVLARVHVYLFYEPRKKTAIRMLLQSSAGFRVGKISQCACAFLDESLAWVLRKSLFCVQQPAGFRHFTEVCEVASHGSRRFPPLHLKHRRTFALFTTSLMRTRCSWCATKPATPSVERPIQRGEHHADVERTPTGALADRGQCTDATPRACPRSRR